MKTLAQWKHLLPLGQLKSYLMFFASSSMNAIMRIFPTRNFICYSSVEEPIIELTSFQTLSDKKVLVEVFQYASSNTFIIDYKKHDAMPAWASYQSSKVAYSEKGLQKVTGFDATLMTGSDNSYGRGAGGPVQQYRSEKRK